MEQQGTHRGGVAEFNLWTSTSRMNGRRALPCAVSRMLTMTAGDHRPPLLSASSCRRTRWPWRKYRPGSASFATLNDDDDDDAGDAWLGSPAGFVASALMPGHASTAMAPALPPASMTQMLRRVALRDGQHR